MKLAEDLYAYPWQGNDNNCNTYLFAKVLKDNKHIIIDPGHIVTPYTGERAAQTLLKNIKNDELNPEDIGMVILTHAHPDHIEAAWHFQKEYNAIIGLSKNDEVLYKKIGGYEKIDFFIESGELKYEDWVQEIIEIYNVPGHSPGHIAVYWPEKKALAAGDVIFYKSTGRVDLPGGNAAELKNSIDKLSKLDVEYLLCGHAYGHPGIIKGKEAVKENFEYLKNNLWF
jgi:hydroxyacylglutathione hydrolase